jgi:putative flippase GtrA
VRTADLKGSRETNCEGHDFSRATIAPLPPALAAEGNRRGTVLRWLKFNAVGVLGIGVQVAVLLTLKSGFHLSYLPATALSVEAAVLHNFLWHERYTWSDRVQPSWRKSLPRLLRFNLTTGGVSIAGNLALMKLMVGLGHMNYLVANGIAIALCSLANFLVSEEWVFAKHDQWTQNSSRLPLAGPPE